MITVFYCTVYTQFVFIAVFNTVSADTAIGTVFPVAFVVALLTVGTMHTVIDGTVCANILARFFATTQAEGSAVFTQQTYLTPQNRSIAPSAVRTMCTFV